MKRHKVITRLFEIRQCCLWNKTTYEVHYYISSLSFDARLFAQAVRSHWGIDNSLHWGGVSAVGLQPILLV